MIDASTDAVTGSFPASAPSFLAYDSQTNALYVASRENGQILAYNATTYASLGPALDIQSSIVAGGIAYDANDHDVYVSNMDDSSISVISTTTQYPVTFTESGLVSGTSWSVDLNGTSNSSTTPNIGFVEPDGTLPFTVGPVSGYVANVTAADVTVSGAGVTVYIGFTSTSPASYPVMFNETGLPSGTMWSVTLGGVNLGSVTSSISFSESAGPYTFAVGSVPGYGASPSSGSIVVTNAPRFEDITFSAGSGALTASLTAEPASLTLGDSTTLTTTTGGGVAPFSYVYTGLPKGCTTANSTSLPCTSTTLGTFNVTVTVTDHSGAHAVANATLKVLASPSSSSGPSGLSTTDWVIIAIVVIAALLALLFVVGRRRRKVTEAPSTSGVPPLPMPPPPPAAPP